MRAVKLWMAVTATAVALGTPAARGQDEAQDGRALGQKLRERLPPSGELEPVDVRGDSVDVGSAAARTRAGERPVVDPREARAPRARAVSLAEAQKLLGDLDLQRRFAELRRCRGQVALERRVPVREVLAGQVQVRWTITEQGRAEEVTVDALAPTEPAVLDCVYARASAWRFERAPDERLQLTRNVTFERATRR
jgi:hypothetical protein